MNKTIISWTKATWNPVHGCSKVSEGCRYCYAEALSLRYGWTKKSWVADNAKDNITLKPGKLNDPFKMKEPSMIFVNSMSDLFHPEIPDSYRQKIFDVMRATPHHSYQVLTKRPELALNWQDWPDNVWMGATVESDKWLSRIDAIRSAGAQIKFLSCEPLLSDLTGIDLSGIDWVIVGGESGNHMSSKNNPRWMRMQWARNIRDASVKAGTAYFFKQDSGIRTEMRPWLVEEDGSHLEWHQFPGNFVAPILLPHHERVISAV